MLSQEELGKYFTLSEQDNCVYFTGERLLCWLPKRYMHKDLLTITGDTIKCFSVFTMYIYPTTKDIEQDTYIVCGLQLPTIITIDAVESTEVKYRDAEYYLVRLDKGSRLICDLNVMQMDKLGYEMWMEFLSTGNLPEYLDYSNIYRLMHDVKRMTGVSISADTVVWEVIYSNLFRDKEDLTKLYRYTDMKSSPQLINLREISYVPTTHDKIIGSYSAIGRTSALLNQSESHHELEDFFRA